MKRSTARKWDRAQTYVGWVAILLLGISLTGSDLGIGPVNVSHSPWLGGLVSLVALLQIGVNIRRDVRAARQAASR